MANLEADVPEEGEKALDCVAKQLVVVAVEQDQQIDVGEGVQLTAAIAADGDQRDIRALVPVEALPGGAQDLIDEPGAIFDQAADVAAGEKTLVEHFARLANGLLICRDGAGLERQLCLELAEIEQLGVHLGHARSSVWARAGWRRRSGRNAWNGVVAT